MKRPAGLSGLVGLFLIRGVVAMHAQNFPFPQHVTYTAGTIKPALPQTALDQTTKTFYDEWKAHYLVNGCQPSHSYVYYSVDPGYTPDPTNAITTSEAHGYGMLILALMAGYDPKAQADFDAMYRYFLNHQSTITPSLMAWQQITGCVPSPDGTDSATDGDLDIAYALLLADRQWGGSGSINYLAEGRKIIAAVMNAEINTKVWFVRLGDWTSSSHTGTRTSDFMMDHFRSFQRFGGDANWSRVLDKCYSIIDWMQTHDSAATGLLPDFIINTSTTPAPAGPDYIGEGPYTGQYSYNACRTPWRLATDYLVSGDSRALAALNKLNAWIRSKTDDDPASIRAGYNLTDGSALDAEDTSMAFTAPFAVSAMVNASNQPWLNKLWTNLTTTTLLQEGSYFGNTIKMIDLIVLSGNWWSPTLKPAVITKPARLADGSFSCQIICEPQFTLQLQASTNFVNWSPLLTTNPPAGIIDFVDTQASTFPRRFYRGR